MTRRLLRRIPFVSVATLDSAAAAAEWWDVTGTASDCDIAYAAVGAASLAASYVNLANSGTYDAAPGVAPTWDTSTGWTFNGSTQYLTTGFLPDGTTQAKSMAIRFANATTTNAVIAGAHELSSVPYARFELGFKTNSATTMEYGNGDKQDVSPARDAGVICVAGTKAYFDGVDESVTIAANSDTLVTLYVGCRHLGVSAGSFFGGDILALAVYNVTLTPAQVATLSTNMAAL